MPFSTTGSVVSTDLDNMQRGLYRDNSDHALTGTTNETTLASFSVAANTIGSTGCLHLIACGIIAGVAGTKTFRLKFGGTTVATITDAAGTTSDWYFEAWLYNTATNAQRWSVQRNANDLSSNLFDYTTTALDTTANQTLLISGQLGAAGDTVTLTMFDVFIAQIT
jgi:hypothetical protein